MSVGKFKARFSVYEDCHDIQVWDDELTPFKSGKCSIREWVQMHLDDYDNQALRELLSLPAMGEFEALIDASIISHTYFSPEVGEDYEEDIEIHAIQTQPIPQQQPDKVL